MVERSVIVSGTPEAAFTLWTDRFGLWWPLRAHSFTREGALEVVLESHVGGRIFERARDGTEHDWGTITEFDPPRRLRHTWYLGFTPAEATNVEVRFDAHGGAQTLVTVIQTGFERLDGESKNRRDGNERGWAGVIPLFEAAARRQ